LFVFDGVHARERIYMCLYTAQDEEEEEEEDEEEEEEEEEDLLIFNDAIEGPRARMLP
jgi:hypothetical protein